MPLAEKVWRASGVYNIPAFVGVKGLLNEMKVHFDAELAANPSAAQWRVGFAGDVGANGRVIELKSPDVDSDGIRIPLFGGEAPNSGALFNETTPSALKMYIGVTADTRVSDGPDTNFTVGAMYSGVHVGGIGCTISSMTPNRFRYWETGDQIVLALWTAGSAVASIVFGAGRYIRKTNDDSIIGSFGATTAASDTWWTDTSVNTNMILSPAVNWSPTHAKMTAILGTTPTKVARNVAIINTNALKNSGDEESDFLEIPVVDASDRIGFLNQMRLGKKERMGLVLANTALNLRARAVSRDDSGVSDAIYLFDPIT